MKYLLIAILFVSQLACVDKNNTKEIDPETVATNPDWTEASHSNDVEPDYDTVFPQDKVNTLEITIGKTNWEAIKADMVAKNKGTFGVGGGTQPGGGGQGGGGLPPGGNGGGVPSFGEEPKYVETTIKFNGKKWENVGFRLKGNSTLSSTWKSGIYKLPFRLKFDEFEDAHPEINDQRLYGFKELSFSAGVKDNSLIREKVTADIFRMAGIPAAQTSFYKLYIDFGDGLKYCGIYAMVEVVDDTMLKTQLGEDAGNIYKPESNFTSFSEATFEKKNNKTEADYSDVKGAITALNASNRTSDAAAWRTNLEKYMDMDQFVKWLAINTTLVNWDTYGGIAHNHYLYNHSKQKLIWIPWDNNEALTSQERVKLNLSGVASTWPLIKYVSEDQVYYAKYKAYVKEFNDNTFTTSKMNALFEKATNMITPFVNGSEKEAAPYSNLSNVSQFTAALPILKTHVVTRNNAVKAFVP
ncbi:CotH kinase family protein [Lacihabitans sp. CS3-21]|uniref:CotH kinase family protein n=1 Tax=Lacihabitans sp. CS3-21 TaxID=2487332 RepID=UPI0020CE16A2|nr:CotH kinase family protein [Lacihabitans sp. CS3-21]MCP9747304.1 spore coat protein CotH [Lacihabitans sp. CS3-21]